MQIQLTSDNVGSSRHLRISQNIHLYAENLRNGNSAKYFTHYAIPQIIAGNRALGLLALRCADKTRFRFIRTPDCE